MDLKQPSRVRDGSSEQFLFPLALFHGGLDLYRTFFRRLKKKLQGDWYFHTDYSNMYFRQKPVPMEGPALPEGSDVNRCYKFISISIYNLLSLYKLYLL